MKIMIKIAEATPPKPKEVPKEYQKESIYDKINRAIECFECDVDRDEAWNYLLRLNNFIMQKEDPSPKELRALKMILPLMDKHGQQGDPCALTDIAKLKLWGLK